MTDITKVQGPSGSPQGAAKKEAAIDADKFKEQMNKRVTEVSAVDPDEQKKRKQAEEEEEDLNAPQAGPTTPASQVTPFSMEQGTEKASPFAMQSGGAGTSPMDSPQLTQLPSPPSTAFFQVPADDETQDDSGPMEEPPLGASAPAAAEAETTFTSQQQTTTSEQAQQQAQTEDQQAQQQTQQVQQQQQTQQQETGWTPEGEQTIAPGPPESAQQQSGEQGQEGTVAAGPSEEEAGSGGMGKPSGGMTAAGLEGTEPSQTQTSSSFFQQLGKEQGGGGKKGKQGAETPEEIEEEAEAQGAVPGPGQPAPFSLSVEGPGEKKVEEKEKAAGAETTGLPMTIDQALAQTPMAPGVETLPSYANIHPQVQDLYDRMVGVMTVMQSSGVNETTITLNSPQFASSVFFGTQIIIQEYSTAPQAYNIQINGTPQAVALFQGNADDLMAAFQSGNYNFRVNRLETGYLSDRPLFKRKGKVSGDKDQKGDTP